MKGGWTFALVACGVMTCTAGVHNVTLDTSADRVRTPLRVDMKRVGTLRPRANGIEICMELSCGNPNYEYRRPNGSPVIVFWRAVIDEWENRPERAALPLMGAGERN